jgi:hypothetical protein
MGSGPWRLQDPGFLATVLRRSSPSLALADLQVFAVPTDARGYYPGYSAASAKIKNRFTWLLLKAHTQNHDGSVELASDDPTARPRIHFRSFDESKPLDDPDLGAIVEGVKFVRDVIGRTRTLLDGDRVDEVWPGPDVRSDEDIARFVRREAWGHHACCTNKMGTEDDDDAVVDPQFRVIGTEHLPRRRRLRLSRDPRDVHRASHLHARGESRGYDSREVAVSAAFRLLAACALSIATLGCSAPQSTCADLERSLQRCGLPAMNLECSRIDDSERDGLVASIAEGGCSRLTSGPRGEVDPRVCKLGGWPCPASPTPTPGAALPRHPLVFVSGIDGTPTFDWNPRVEAALRDRGLELHVVHLLPWAPTAERAADLFASLEVLADGRGWSKMNLVCYAVGGLDCRFLLSENGLFAGDATKHARALDLVASVTTVATPASRNARRRCRDERACER